MHRWRVPAWTEYYVDYSRLKALVNTKPPLVDLKEAIRLEIDIVDTFLSAQDYKVEAQIEALNEHWGIKIGSMEPTKYHGISTLELEDLQTSLLECAHEVTQCHLYAKVSHDAFSRIFDKAAIRYSSEEVSDINILSRLACHGQSSSHGPWLPKLNATLQLVREAMEHEEAATPSRSLLLEHFGMHHFPPETIQYLREDDAIHLEAAMNRRYPNPSPERQSVLARLVQVAIIHRSSGYDDYLHRIIQQLGRSQPHLDSPSAANSFHQILKLLHPSQLLLLQSQDVLGRLPLHYAARLGLDGVCREIIAAVRNPAFETSPEQVRVCPDVFGLTPLDYAVQHGHTRVVELLLSEHKSRILSDRPDPVEKLDILATAISSKFTDIAMRLTQEGWGVHFVGRSGKTVLHLASEHGLSALVKGLVALEVDVNAQDSARGWTPLVTACVHGHADTVETLLQAGADASIPDRQGWLPKDHAAYRGDIKIINTIKTRGSPSLSSKLGTQLGEANILPRRSSTDSVIFVYPVTLDLFKKVTEVDVTPYRRRISSVQIPDTYLDLSIYLVGDRNQQEHKISLPVISETSDQPWCFTASDPDSAAIVFKITSSLEEKPIGTAVALLGSLKEGLGANRESLIRDFTIPLVSDKYGHVGTVVFTFVVARPFKRGQHPPRDPQILKLESSSTIGGHRGNGQNDSLPFLQVGENTLQSFRTAIDHGANVVEFDVQLTKDNIPVIYHDFLFTAINDAKSISKPPHGPPRRLPWDERDRPRALLSSRRRSLCAPLDSATEALVSEMEFTLNHPGYKPSLRSHSIREPFVTLEELFHSLPEEVPFDIELKYPMLYEAVDSQMDTFASEVNHFLDTILTVTYAHAGPRRRVIFSSFSPEICMVLAVKQQSYPILFLNDSSNWPTGDMRATSLQTAVRFAHRFGLAGVAMASEPFVASPGLVEFVRNQGLYTASYGPLNDDVSCVEIQAKAGVDLIIVNKVKLVKQVLSNRENGQD
ncbi:Glycerophosphoryl diester phosphodiesterase family-domain-containing protein [Ilyonectria sp. MPI-CAGE-AT-0026]|nr:Glycerophosphoryl diester phosphodiesterase family-domain-containing protein [Ilyonectria sp. MPI-CAGE-AT-0026]